jgi:hypothetical protein
MTSISLIGGEKGGLGKSLTAMVVLEYHIHRAIKYILFDTDRTNPDVGRIYEPKTYTYSENLPDKGLEVERDALARPIYFSEDEEDIYLADEIFNQACQGPERSVLVNLPAQVEMLVHRWLKTQDILSLAKQENINIVYWFVTDGSPESTELLKQNLQRYEGEDILWFLVKNHGLNKKIDDDLNRYLTGAELSKMMGILELPKLNLDKKELNRIKSEKIPLGEIAKREKRKDFPLLTKQRLKNFLDVCFAQMDELKVFFPGTPDKL